MEKKDIAKNAAIARSKQAVNRPPSGGPVGKAQAKGNQFAFYTEDSSGLKLSPKTVLIISLLYMGIVVLLHIFGKMKSGEGKKDLWVINKSS